MTSSNDSQGGNLWVAPGLKAALRIVVKSYDYARTSNRNVWEFAVEIERLEAQGADASDVRWLICNGYALHGLETTNGNSAERAFRPLASLALPAGAGVVLTPQGMAVIGSQAQTPVNNHSPEGGPKTTDHLPATIVLPQPLHRFPVHAARSQSSFGVNGIRPALIRGPSNASTAGTRVFVSNTLIPATRNPATPMERISLMGTVNKARNPMATVEAEISSVRPA